MQTAVNPFTPTFGTVPAHMAGREYVIHELTVALDNGPGDPNLVTIVSGARGTGKTALLSYMATEASARGWISVNVSALPGMLEEVAQQTERAASHLLSQDGKVNLSSLRLGNVAELRFDQATDTKPTWRIRMTELLERLAETDTGLLITIDEIREDLDEMIHFASDFQHFVREGRNVGLFMAGLPNHVSALLQDKSVSFLRRANYYEIGAVDDFEVEQAMRRTIEEAGRSVDSDALAEAVRITAGFPYLIQLLGFRSWNASPGAKVVSLEDVESGARYAENDMKRKIFDTTFRELSKGDIRFLEAMLPDEGMSNLSDIAERMNKKSNYASEYRRRLVEQGVLEDCGQGDLRIAIPFFKDYLRERLGA